MRKTIHLIQIMRLFWELTKISFQRHLTYRTAAIAGLVTNFFFGILRAMILVALYDLQPSVEGISIKGAITYAALSQALIGFLSMFHWYDLMNTIYTGDVASDLLKPMNYFRFWMAQDLGRALVQLILRGFTLLFAFTFVFDLYWPKTLPCLFGLLLSIPLGWLVSFSWRFLINLSAFWTPNARGILRFIFVLSWFFSGFMMPLRFFPEWVIRIAHLMPFPYMFNTVVEIYLGILNGPELIQAILYQVLWGLGLIFIGQLILRMGVRRLVVLGG
jgi:ABC-2 type transport system permease protein